MGQVVGGHALQHGGGGLLEVDAIRDFDENFRRDGGVFGIGAGHGWCRQRDRRVRIRLRPSSDGFDGAGGFLPGVNGIGSL